MSRLRAALAVLFVCLIGGGTAVVLTSSGTSQSATGSVHPSGWGSTPKGFVAPPRALAAVPTATMYDAVTLSNVPSHPFAVAGYIAGSWPTWFQLASAFPGAHHVSIAIHLGQHAMCGDFEPGDMDPSTAGQWAKEDTGFKTPCLYGDLSNMPTIKASLASAYGSTWRSHVLLWLAWYTGNPALPAGYDAIQFTDNALGRNLDENTVTLNFLKIASPPYVAPPVLPLCFHKRESAKTCTTAKNQITSANRAIASSQRAFAARKCPAIQQRITWFSSHLKSQPKVKTAYRQAALSTSRKAFKRQGCPVFQGRIRGNQGAIKKIEAAN